MGRNWTRRSIEELIDEYLKKHAKVIPGPTPPVTGGLGAIHASDGLGSFGHIDVFNIKNTDNQGANYQQSIKPLQVPIDGTGADTLDTNFGLSYPSSTYYIGRFSRSSVISSYHSYQKPYYSYERRYNGVYYDLVRWFYYDSVDNIIYRIKGSNYTPDPELNPFPAGVITGGYMFQNRTGDMTPDINVYDPTNWLYVAYYIVNLLTLYNIVNISDISILHNGHLIGSTIHLTDDFIKKYIQWFISSGTLPTAVQDLIIS